jgi:phage terminase small subunit
MARATIINDIRKFLFQENIISSKDEMTLFLLETTYSQWVQAVKEVKSKGQTIVSTDFNGKPKVIVNPAFRNQMELQKQLFKLMDSLYLSPKSRKSKKEDNDVENPFITMMKEINEVEKR